MKPLVENSLFPIKNLRVNALNVLKLGLVLAFFCPIFALAQTLQAWDLVFKDASGKTFPMPLVGGLNSPQLSAVDLNADYTLANNIDMSKIIAQGIPEQAGDVYARYLCRMEEMKQSLRIMRQALDNLPDGPVNADDPKVVPPPRSKLGSSMEAVIHHFKIWTEGFKAPKGFVKQSIESPRGEFMCYLRGDGGSKPARVHFRTPSYVNLASIPHMSRDLYVADLISIIGSVDIVLGEIDR